MHFTDNSKLSLYKKFARLACFAFFVNIPNLIFVLIEALHANTIVVWIDFLASISETLHVFIVWLVANKMCNENGDKYNFGMDRLEVFISFICELVICIGMGIMIVGSIFNIIKPTAPNSTLIWFIILKACCVFFDIYIYSTQTKITKANPSKLNHSEKHAFLMALINDSVMLVIAIICYLLRTYNFAMYFSPSVSIILAIYFIIGYAKNMHVSMLEIIDFSLPINIQDAIYDIVMEKRNGIVKINYVNCRKLNGKAFIEISLVMQDNLTYKEINEYLDELKNSIYKVIENANVKLIIE